jgi:hypothetical protein
VNVVSAFVYIPDNSSRSAAALALCSRRRLSMVGVQAVRAEACSAFASGRANLTRLTIGRR